MWLPIAAAILAQSLSVSAGIAPRAEQFSYRFDNPSTFDSNSVVPHFFEQKYTTIPIWFSGDVRYHVDDISARTTAGLSLRGTTPGSDIDTFMLQSGDIATSGTNGRVRLRSWELGQRLAIEMSSTWSLGLSVSYRHDAADFLPADRIVTHTLPASETRTFITDRESTTSHVVAVGADIERTAGRGSAWQFRYGVSVQPVIFGQLTIQLPDKYPGVDLTFSALSFGATASCALERRMGAWRSGVEITASGARGYQVSRSYDTRRVAVTAFIGR